MMQMLSLLKKGIYIYFWTTFFPGFKGWMAMVFKMSFKDALKALVLKVLQH